MKNKGVALLLALLTLIIISLLVVAFLELTTIDLQIVSNHLSRNQALYIADAGVEYAISNLRSSRNSFATPLIVFPPGSGNTYNMTYSNSSGIITSEARLSSGQRVTLAAKVSAVGNSPPYRLKIIYWSER